MAWILDKGIDVEDELHNGYTLSEIESSYDDPILAKPRTSGWIIRMKLDDIYPRDLSMAVLVLRTTAFVVTAVILWGTLWPNASTPSVNIVFADKLWHVLAFWIWTGIVAWGWPSLGWKAFAAAAFIGAMIELIQPLLGREAELADLIADFLGAALGVWSARLLLLYTASRRPGKNMPPQIAAE